MDPTTRRLTGIGLALTFAGVVYAMTGDGIKAAVSFAGVALCLLWGFWPDIRSRFGGMGRTLQVDVFLDHLSSLSDSPRELLAAGFLERQFAMLRVRNDGNKNLTAVAASCSLRAEDEEIRCAWSLAPGPIFEGVGNHSADLNVGETRLLVFAQVFPADHLWARLPRQRPIYEVAGRVFSLPSSVVRFVDLSSERLDFVDRSVELRVSFLAEGLGQVQTRAIRLDFEDGKPTARLL